MPLARLGRSNSNTNVAWQKLVGDYQERVMAIALRLSRGELRIGMIDKTAYDGDIQYLQCDLSGPFWAIKGASIHAGEKEEQMQMIIFDTTSQFIRGPKSSVQRIYNTFGRSKDFKFDSTLGLYEIPCNIPEGELPKISIHVGTSTWWMTEPKQYAFSLHSSRDWSHWTFTPRYSFQQTMPTHPGLCFGLLAAHTDNTMSSRTKEPPARPNDWLTPPYVRTSFSGIDLSTRLNM